jgi:hypothetical protein
MARGSASHPKPVFHAPVLVEWTDDKLKALSQEQLLNLLGNLDRQRAIGRISAEQAAAADQRIAALLTKANSSKRRKQLARAATEAAAP